MIHLIIDLFLCSQSFSKIFEKVIYNRLYHHINNNLILVDEQFGFKHALAIDIVSYKLTKNIQTALNNKLLVGGIFCDLHKAFDCVNHDILLSKMEFYGIYGKSNNPIKSYLQDRYQRALADLDSKKCYSKWESVKDGVPQGSLLRPLLFPLYEGKSLNNRNFIVTFLQEYLQKLLVSYFST